MSKNKPNGGTTQRVAKDAESMRLAREDQIRFAKALISPPKTNARLARAANTHARLITNR